MGNCNKKKEVIMTKRLEALNKEKEKIFKKNNE
jgi:hypothetical protein